MIKVKVGQILVADQVFSKLLEQKTDVKLTYGVTRLVKAFVPALKAFDKIRFDLMKKHFKESTEKPGIFNIDEATKPAFEEELRPHYSDDVEVNANPLLFDQVYNAKFDISAIDLMNIECFIVGDPDGVKIPEVVK